MCVDTHEAVSWRLRVSFFVCLHADVCAPRRYLDVNDNARALDSRSDQFGMRASRGRVRIDTALKMCRGYTNET